MKTNCSYFVEDLGKNLYRKKTFYTVCIEQEVIAQNKDEADKLFLDHGGIDYEKVSDIAEDGMGVETYCVDANYAESGETEYLGKVVYEDCEYAQEDGFVEIDPYAPESEKEAA